jgi:predicted Zn-dependent protease
MNVATARHATPLATRLVAIVVAVLACAWFALGAVQAHDVTRVNAILNSPTLTARQIHDARSLLRTAGTLNPDTQVDILRAELLQGENNNAAARALYRAVLRKEPKNVLAWDLLAQAGDPSALRHVAQLEPNVPGQ